MTPLMLEFLLGIEKSVRLPSFAKINLCLHVLRKRGDGYHDIETVFQQVSLNDEIILQPSKEGIQLFCAHPDVPNDESNLCFKAALLLQRYNKNNSGCSIRVSKQIPVAAGLGGGSSNAAVTLLGLNVLWSLGLSKSELVSLSTEIGSDVPFFIEGGKALGTGRGEKITLLQTPSEFWCVITSPPLKISSKWAYQSANFSLTNKKKSCKLLSLKESQTPPEHWNTEFYNDLESIVFNSFPQLKWIRDQLEAGGAFLARMSGSGPCIFGLFHSLNKAQEVKKRFDSQCQVRIVRPIKWGYDELQSKRKTL